jgi:hypothetical protein
MNIETIYSILMNSGWFFLLGWALLLLFAYVAVFRDKSPKRTLRLVRSQATARYIPDRPTLRKIDRVGNVAVPH